MALLTMAIITKFYILLISKQYFLKIINKFQHIDNCLNIKPNVIRREKRISWVITLLAVAVCVFILAYPLIVHAPFFMLSVSNAGSIIQETQFIILCYIVQLRFKILNKNISEISNHLQCDNITKANVTIINLRARNGLSYFNNQTLFVYVKFLKEVHLKLCRNCYLINKLFEMVLLLNTSCNAVSLLASLYFAAFGGYYRAFATDINELRFGTLLQLSWALFHAMRVIFLAVSAATVTNQATETKTMIASVLTCNMDAFSKEELTAMFHVPCSNKINFTAFGFFNVNKKFISTFLCTGLSYFVILVQFQSN